MKRRTFIAGVGGAVAAWPLVAGAQHAATPVVGVLNAVSSVGRARELAGFRQGLNEGGYSRAGTWQSNIARPTANMSNCRHWPPTWFVVG